MKCIRNTPRLVPVTAVLAALTLCCSCADRSDGNSYVQDRVNTVKGRTVPSDATVASNSGPTFSRYLATGHWEFETSEETGIYVSWVSQQLKQDDFKLKVSDESSLVLTKSSGEEWESVKIQTALANGKLHVHITYTIDSD